MHGLKWIELTVKRSQAYPLTIDVMGISGRGAISVVDRELHRTESLSVVLPFRPYVYEYPDAFTNLQNPAPPGLRSLTVGAMITFAEFDGHWLVFNGQWSQVRSLRVEKLTPEWRDCELGRLERLEIEGRGYRKPDLAEILQVLGRCPDLLFVRLGRAGFHVQGKHLPDDVITLPRLTTFILNDSPVSSSALLRRVQMPKCQYFKFVHEGWEEDGGLAGLLDALMPTVETCSVQAGNSSNTALFFSNQKTLIIQCELESPSLVTALQFHLHLQRSITRSQLLLFQESSFWKFFEECGMIIREGESGELLVS